MCLIQHTTHPAKAKNPFNYKHLAGSNQVHCLTLSLFICDNGHSRGHCRFCNLARPKRFELLTPWFVAKYSIQLSYGRGKLFYVVTLAEREGFEPSIQVLV